MVFCKIIYWGFQFHHAVPILVGAIGIAVSERGNLIKVNYDLEAWGLFVSEFKQKLFALIVPQTRGCMDFCVACKAWLTRRDHVGVVRLVTLLVSDH